MDIGQLDLRLLECLQVLVEERHVTRAADRLGTTQPKLSSTLARLRAFTGDPLFIRTPQGMFPTPCAVELAQLAGELLHRVHTTLAKRAAFDPRTSEQTFRLQAVDFLISTVLTRVITMLRTNAPNVRIIVGPPQVTRMREALESGEADLILTHMQSAPDTLFASRLELLSYSCIASAGHPTIREKISLEQFLTNAHVTLSFGREHMPYVTEQALDEALLKLGHKRIKAVQVPAVLAVPTIVAQTDLIATIPTALAIEAARTLPLQVLTMPLERPPTAISLVWHVRTHKDPGHQWLRSAIHTLCTA